MINIIWFLLMAISIIIGLTTGKGEIISSSIVKTSHGCVELMIKLVGIMCFWCGIMRIAEESGISEKIGKALKPILNKLFKDVPKDEKAMGAVVMNLTSNMLGLSNAATPFGIKAMKEMQKLNKDKDTASDDMALFLVLNAACIQLVPTSVISIRVACGSKNPGIIIIPAIITTFISAIVGIICCKILEKYF